MSSPLDRGTNILGNRAQQMSFGFVLVGGSARVRGSDLRTARIRSDPTDGWEVVLELFGPTKEEPRSAIRVPARDEGHAKTIMEDLYAQLEPERPLKAVKDRESANRAETVIRVMRSLKELDDRADDPKDADARDRADDSKDADDRDECEDDRDECEDDRDECEDDLRERMEMIRCVIGLLKGGTDQADDPKDADDRDERVKGKDV